MPGESQPPPAPGGRIPLAGWICITIVGIAVAEAVGEAVRPSLEFWLAFVVKVAAGGAGAAIAGIAVWRWFAGRKS
jgi:hypothetical protein